MYGSTSGIEDYPDAVLLAFACDSDGTTPDVVEEGSPRRPVRHIRVDLSKALLADTLATLSGKSISVLLLRGVSPNLATILDILHVVQGLLTSLDVALLPPPHVDPPGYVGVPREDKDMPSVSNIQPLESPTTALIEWLVTSGSCAHLQELVVDVDPQPGNAPQEDFPSKFSSLNKLLRAAGLSLVRLDIINHPLGNHMGRHDLSLASNSALNHMKMTFKLSDNASINDSTVLESNIIRTFHNSLATSMLNVRLLGIMLRSALRPWCLPSTQIEVVPPANH
ncbi:hypothetical protein FOMPIDRAFT_93187 [Fomitopsis schrenkii]|uniref:Uncharacterized protein n=1 Tax=Fomitopsis schrenkii TaxID=2126942 RepID=S8DP53_FOMSC|nr:hypothetical protein FOMPIDRAFT_93187 [Fomitopsis schrenkii]